MLIEHVAHMRELTLLVCVVLGAVSVVVAVAPSHKETSASFAAVVVPATLVALVLRAAFAFVQAGAAYDINSYALIGGMVRHGVDAYSAAGAGHYNYPPVELWWSALASHVFPGGPADQFAILAKAPFWLADAAIVPVVAWMVPSGHRRRAAWLYAINPIAITVACLHGQFDALVILPLLVSIALLQRSAMSRSAFLFGVAVAVKTWPLLVLPAVLSAIKRSRWPRYVVGLLVPSGVAVVAYLIAQPGVDLGAAVRRVLGYVPPPTDWVGIGALLPGGTSSDLLTRIDLVVYLLVIAIALLESRAGRPVEQRVALAAFLVIALSPTVGNQYYVWPIALLLVARRERIAAVYTGLVAPAIAYVALFVNAPPFVTAPPPYARIAFAVATAALIGLAVLLIYELVAATSESRSSRRPSQSAA